MRRPLRQICVLVAIPLAWTVASLEVRADYQVTNLVSDIQGLASTYDPNLKNPWGVANAVGGPFWVSNAGSDTSTLYDGLGAKAALTVNVPGGPTGQIFNSTSGFQITGNGSTSASTFVFDTLAGGIYGWSGKTGVVAAVTGTGANYTGLASGTSSAGNVIFAADNLNNKVDVYGSNFQSLSGSGGAFAGKFVDNNLPAGFSVFNVIPLNGIVYVTYNSPSGGGVIDRFDLNGNYLGRFIDNPAGGALAGPWSMVMAPTAFGKYGGDLLVSNNDNGTIAAFNPTTGAFLGDLDGTDGNPLINTGIWTIEFGNTVKNGDPNALYIFAGINDEQDGLIAAITTVPEPGSASLMVIGGAFALVAGYRRRNSKRD